MCIGCWRDYGRTDNLGFREYALGEVSLNKDIIIHDVICKDPISWGSLMLPFCGNTNAHSIVAKQKLFSGLLKSGYTLSLSVHFHQNLVSENLF